MASGAANTTKPASLTASHLPFVSLRRNPFPVERAMGQSTLIRSKPDT
ncbi:hypothetical protein CLV78_10256 [Aliiruegeria haliotis]|uniref:Uncharacterized protein n=1 Tax=Aliiruegeria haliotis TaxID=1280846 RepID=A0A2T0RUP4_9RHOB|nr:hypothetical protein CLV78_10256 [Aliiruegeria haliotis]